VSGGSRRRREEADRDRAAREVDAELAFHRERTLEELTAKGLPREDADAEARRRFGPEAPYRRTLIHIEMQPDPAGRGRTAVDVLAVSLRSVIRDVRRVPAFTASVVAILTLGLGVNAITFGLVDRLVLSGPAGISAPEDLRLVVVHRRNQSGASIATSSVGYLDYQDLRQADRLAGAAGESRSPLLFGSGDSAERVEAALVTASYFPLLGASPALGRFFTAEESERDGARVAVLGQAFWERRFGGDPGVIGQAVPIESHRYTVVGVAPRHFTGSSVRRVDVFLPLEAASDELVAGPWRTSRNFSWMQAIARLAPEMSDAAAAAQITTVHRRAYAAVRTADPEARVELEPLNAVRGATASDERSIAALVAGVALLVLVIAIANVSNLFLARSLRRRDRIAIQMALGGARSRLVAEQATEGALLALAGAAVAVALAWAGGPAVQRLMFPSVAWLETAVNLRLLAVLAAGAVAGGAVSAALPMWQVNRSDAIGWLRVGSMRAARRRTRTQAAMIVVQGTLSVVLLVGAGLFVRSLARAQTVDLGLDTERLLVVATIEGDAPLSADFRDRLRAAVGRIPGVEGTTRVAGTFPFVSSWSVRLAVAGLPDRPRVDDGGPYIHAVEPGYFQTVGTTLVEGRPFTAEDRAGAPRVVVVNQSMARLFWPGETALGKCVHIGPDSPPCSVVVGIAENTRRQEIVEGESLLFYVPIDQAEDNLRAGGRVIIRTTADDTETVGRVAELVRRQALSLAPGLRYVRAVSLADGISPQLRSWRLGAALFGVFGVLALVVATIGLYSVMAFDVEGRRREMGLRAALGASASSLLGLILRDGLRISVLGIAIGTGAAWLLAPSMSGLLFRTEAQDRGVFASVAAVLIGAAIAASALPGLRASHVDPGRALREE
jgi:predicted permease